MLSGGYKFAATSDLQTALRRVPGCACAAAAPHRCWAQPAGLLQGRRANVCVGAKHLARLQHGCSGPCSQPGHLPSPPRSRTCRMWLISMPVAAAQLVLLTAAEDAALVGDEGFASALPLAATGPGEPFVTAAGVLGE